MPHLISISGNMAYYVNMQLRWEKKHGGLKPDSYIYTNFIDTIRKCAVRDQPQHMTHCSCSTLITYIYIQSQTVYIIAVSFIVQVFTVHQAFDTDILNFIAATWLTVQLPCATLTTSTTAWQRSLQSRNEGIHQQGAKSQHRKKQVWLYTIPSI